LHIFVYIIAFSQISMLFVPDITFWEEMGYFTFIYLTDGDMRIFFQAYNMNHRTEFDLG